MIRAYFGLWGMLYLSRNKLCLNWWPLKQSNHLVENGCSSLNDSLLHLMHVTQTLQIRPATVIFPDVALTTTRCCTETAINYFSSSIQNVLHMLTAILRVKHALHLYVLLGAEEYIIFRTMHYLFLTLGRPLLDVPIFYSKT